VKNTAKVRECKKCHKVKKASDFYSQETYDGAVYCYCKECTAIYGKEKYKKNRMNCNWAKRRGGKCPHKEAI